MVLGIVERGDDEGVVDMEEVLMDEEEEIDDGCFG